MNEISFFDGLELGLTVMQYAVLIWTNVACWKYINTTVPGSYDDFIPLTLSKVFAALLGVVLTWLALMSVSEGDLILTAILLSLAVLTFGLLFVNLQRQIGWKYGLLGLAVLMASSTMIILMIIILVGFAYLVNDSKNGAGARARRSAERDIQSASMDI